MDRFPSLGADTTVQGYKAELWEWGKEGFAPAIDALLTFEHRKLYRDFGYSRIEDKALSAVLFVVRK